MKRLLPFLTGSLAVIFCLTHACGATLIHDYEFEGNLNDALGGPSLVMHGGTLHAGHYSFAVAEGLSLSNWLSVVGDSGDYTLDLSLRFTSLPGSYAKIVDMKGLTADAGLYHFNPTSTLSWYNGGNTPGTADSFLVDEYFRINLTRDGTSNLLVGYVNGVQQFTIDDSSGAGVFDAAGNILNLFRDDVATGSGEAGGGEINQFRIYSGALTSGEIAALGGPKGVPEPSVMLLLVGGLGALQFRRRRAAG